MPFPTAFRSILSTAALWLACLAPAAACRNLVPFLRELQAEHRPSLLRTLGPDVSRISRSLGFRQDDSATTEAILAPLFLHHLLTTTAPVDGQRGGVLETVYFWHWISPNPRHRIRMLPDSSLLTAHRPHPRHPSYRTFADMDRTPDLFLSDLVSEEPRYNHPEFGTFTTFGWCSEREMAYALILRRMGYLAKIRFQGNHVWTEVLIQGATKDGSSGSGVLVVDNTFASAEPAPLRQPVAAWLSDVGRGRDVVSMNAKAGASAQVRFVDSLQVGPKATSRIRGLVVGWLVR
ncbi:MAG TPA: hypothetical protein PKO15_05165 [Fibrobacteria bacterium]|nr:hypothetical protein [Fibrobacteria bacterium]HOX53224.1 hypothetical protein [Fibrobacteria bacterium]